MKSINCLLNLSKLKSDFFSLKASRFRIIKSIPVLIVVFYYFLSCIAAYSQDFVDLQNLDQYFTTAMEDWKVPGMAIAIVRDNNVEFEKGYGVRNIETGGQVNKNTLFAIASNTKAFTAAALAILVDEGKISWDDRVVEHLQYFQLYDPYITFEMRICDLLSHRSGLGKYSGDLLWYGSTYSSAEVVRRARFLPPSGKFRSDYGYSNLMFIAAGEIIPAVTGQSWSDFVQSRILDELDMKNTVMSIKNLEGRENVASPHFDKDGRTLLLQWSGWDNMTAAGGIISCISDMTKWIRLQLNRGIFEDKRIFSEKASREMWQPHISIRLAEEDVQQFPSTHFKAYGLGWQLMDYLGRRIVLHGGSYDGMLSRVALVPEENLGFVILTNSMTALRTALTYKILDVYLNGEERDWSKEYQLKETEKAHRRRERRTTFEKGLIKNTRPSLKLAEYAGTYGGKMYGDATVTVENGKLLLQFLPTPDLKGDLTHWHYDTFILKWHKQFPWFDEGTVQFIIDANGQSVEMKIDVPNEDFWFTELEFKRKH